MFMVYSNGIPVYTTNDEAEADMIAYLEDGYYVYRR